MKCLCEPLSTGWAVALHTVWCMWHLKKKGYTPSQRFVYLFVCLFAVPTTVQGIVGNGTRPFGEVL